MADSATGYYSSLAPFRTEFSTGVPVLTYHNVGPRPPGARIKGLTVSPDLLSRQLRELRAGEFTPATLDVFATGGKLPGNSIVVTFDDGFRSLREHALKPLRKHGFTGVVFLCADMVGRSNEWDRVYGEAQAPLMDAVEVAEWIAAGQKIGSHTLTHPWLTRLSLEAAREEIAASKRRLEDQFAVPVDHFCYPYGDWNEAVREQVVAAGYRTACTTESGVNTEATDRFQLRRFTARYASRNWKNLRSWLSAKFAAR